MYRDVPGGVFTLTMHPQVIGRGHRFLMLERLIDWFKRTRHAVHHPGNGGGGVPRAHPRAASG